MRDLEQRALLAVLLGTWALVACGGRSDRKEQDPAGGTGGSGAVGGNAPTGGAGTGPVLSQLAEECQSLDTAISNALTDARKCDPNTTSPSCTAAAQYGGFCPCTAFVDVENTDATSRLRSAGQEFADLGCTAFAPRCEPCGIAVSGACDASGQCETSYTFGTGGSGSGGSSGGGGRSDGGSGGANGGSSGNMEAGAGGAATVVDCTAVSQANAMAFEEARKCDPTAIDDQCTAMVTQGAGCGCSAFVNGANMEAVARISSTEQEYQAANCSAGVECGACLPPISGHCGTDGLCAQVASGSGKSCEVYGVVYADGDGNIPSPDDRCNTCSCSDGVLGCTKFGCEDHFACAAGQVHGQVCAACGPTDACTVVEYGCFWPCSAGCADRNLNCVNDLCVETVCR